MNKVYTKSFVRDNLDCYEKQSKVYLPLAEKELAGLGETITLEEIFKTAIRAEDKFWWLLAHTDITVPELQEISVKVAEVAERIYKSETGDGLLGEYLERAKKGIDTTGEIKEMPASDDAAGNAIRSVARAVTSLFTSGHKRPLTTKAILRLLFAARGNDTYVSWVLDLMKTFY